MGGSEIIIIILVVLLLFGAKSIPDMARMLGKGMNEFRRASEEIKREFRDNTSDITDVVDEAKNELNKEVREVNTAVEEDVSDDDPYSLKDDSKEEIIDANEDNETVPPIKTDGPISREDAID